MYFLTLNSIFLNVILINLFDLNIFMVKQNLVYILILYQINSLNSRNPMNYLNILFLIHFKEKFLNSFLISQEFTSNYLEFSLINSVH